MTLAILAAAALAAAPVTADKASRSVTLTAVSTDCGKDAPIEFLLAGPESDHDYEAMFLTEASVKDIAQAFADAGIPLGQPVSTSACRFWPTGGKLEITPDIWTLMRDVRDERKAQVTYTGGTREADGSPVAHTNMPQAVFALYNCPQSLLQFDDALDQSATYGRFLPAVKIPKGEKRTLTFTWKDNADLPLEVEFAPGKLAETLLAIKEKSAGREIDLMPSFSPELTVHEAIEVAKALSVLDSCTVKVNGFKPGQFFFRAFLPRESWRDRKERLTQPYEVRLGGEKPSLAIIKEDWSDTSSSDPKLTVRENVPFEMIPKTDNVDTCFVYAKKGTRLADVFAVRTLLPARVVNWYVYED